MRDLILVDFSWVVHRMWWAHKDLSVVLADGTELKSGHVFGVARLLKTLTEKYPSADIVLCLDGSPKHGKALSADYKANRSPNSAGTAFEDLGVLLTCAMAFPRVTAAFHRDLEADEVISYMAQFYCKHCSRVIIYSADCDMLQLLACADNIFIAKEFDKKSGELLLVDKEAYLSDSHYLDKFVGCDISVLPLYRAMVGDSSDNLAGFPRLRKKLAKELAESYRTEDALVRGCHNGDVRFPTMFKDFLPKLHINYEIMKLPTVQKLEDACCPPRVVGGESNSEALLMYSLYRIRSVAPMETLNLAAWEEREAMRVRGVLNDNWKHPDKG